MDRRIKEVILQAVIKGSKHFQASERADVTQIITVCAQGDRRALRQNIDLMLRYRITSCFQLEMSLKPNVFQVRCQFLNALLRYRITSCIVTWLSNLSHQKNREMSFILRCCGPHLVLIGKNLKRRETQFILNSRTSNFLFSKSQMIYIRNTPHLPGNHYRMLSR